MRRTAKPKNLTTQVKEKSQKPSPRRRSKLDGNTDVMISTGSTLLDLAISGGRVRGGKIPAGILVEVFGPNSAGKTVLLCEIAGHVQRMNGEVMFRDPEARLNKQFAKIFDFDTTDIDYGTPNTVTDVFQAVQKWSPSGTKINGVFTDSLAALSTDMEMDNDEGDKMGMRRAKEFSEGLRKTARILAQKNMLMVCSNQIRQTGNSYGPQTESPGGKAIGFYASLRLKASSPEKIWNKARIAGKEVKRVIGVKTEFEVFKSSVWKPFRTAPVYIIYDYGIDDVRANLQFVKDFTKNNTYTCAGNSLDQSMEKSIAIVEENNWERKLKNEVIDLWEEIESKFTTERKSKQR